MGGWMGPPGLITYLFEDDDVGTHLANLPHIFFRGRPPRVFPPWGWSIGLVTSPLTTGRRPNHREAPALPRTVRLCSGLATRPNVALH